MTKSHLGNRRKTTKRIALYSISAAIVGILGVGTYQSHHNPLSGCASIDTGTNYAGYDCGTHTVYVPEQ